MSLLSSQLSHSNSSRPGHSSNRHVPYRRGHMTPTVGIRAQNVPKAGPFSQATAGQPAKRHTANRVPHRARTSSILFDLSAFGLQRFIARKTYWAVEHIHSQSDLNGSMTSKPEPYKESVCHFKWSCWRYHTTHKTAPDLDCYLYFNIILIKIGIRGDSRNIECQHRCSREPHPKFACYLYSTLILG